MEQMLPNYLIIGILNCFIEKSGESLDKGLSTENHINCNNTEVKTNAYKPRTETIIVKHTAYPEISYSSARNFRLGLTIPSEVKVGRCHHILYICITIFPCSLSIRPVISAFFKPF